MRNVLFVLVMLALLTPFSAAMAAPPVPPEADVAGRDAEALRERLHDLFGLPPVSIEMAGYCKPGAGCFPVYVDETGDTMTGVLDMQADIHLTNGALRVPPPLDDPNPPYGASKLAYDQTLFHMPTEFTNEVVLRGNQSILRVLDGAVLEVANATLSAPIVNAPSNVTFTVNNTTVFRLVPTPGTPHIIGGSAANAIDHPTRELNAGFIGGGGDVDHPNAVRGDYSLVGAGRGNLAGDGATVVGFATVAGGEFNNATASHSFIGGGRANSATGQWSSVGGGHLNAVSGEGSVAAGGRENSIAILYGAVSGGRTNSIWDDYGYIGGGQSNQAGDNTGTSSDSSHATVAGGLANLASGQYAVVGGGDTNTASGRANTVAGGQDNMARGFSGTTVGGGMRNDASGSSATIGGGVDNTVTQTWSTIAGGYNGLVTGSSSAIGGGHSNTAGGSSSTVAGGWLNTASGALSTVGGGRGNQATGGQGSVIGGGLFNLAQGSGSTVAGGDTNAAGGYRSAIGGGEENTASGQFAVVPGGFGNTAGADHTFAAGRNANAAHQGAFVWTDSKIQSLSSTAADQFTARATGGVRFISAIDSGGVPIAGVTLAPGAGAWSSLSDRNMKQDIVPVDPETVLASLLQMPLYEWSYLAQGADVRHMGPMAQDFGAAFGLGEDDTRISTVDADGVALAAIQGLYQEIEERDERIDELEARLAALEAMMMDQGEGP